MSVAYQTPCATRTESLGTERNISDLSDIFDISLESRVRLSKYESEISSGIQEKMLQHSLSKDNVL